MSVPSTTRARRAEAPPPLWPFLLARDVWTSAVVDDEAVRANLRLLWILTALLSLPDLGQGLLLLHAAHGTSRLYALYVSGLALLELGGAVLVGARRTLGRQLILLAAAGFYLEAALGLAGCERSLLSLAMFAACVPADAWVLWFLLHPRVRAYVATHVRADAPEHTCLHRDAAGRRVAEGG